MSVTLEVIVLLEATVSLDGKGRGEGAGQAVRCWLKGLSFGLALGTLEDLKSLELNENGRIKCL